VIDPASSLSGDRAAGLFSSVPRVAMASSPVPRFARFFATLLAFSCATSLAAQETSTIVGTVLDQQSLLAIGNARVSLTDLGVEVRTDDQGNFRIVGIPPGTVTLRGQADGYSSAVDEVRVTPGEISVVQVHLLPVDLVLQEVLVRSGRRPTRDANVVENENKETALTAADLLEREVPGLTVGGRSGNVGSDARMLIRGVSTIQGNAQPTIYLDGVRISGGTQSTPGVARLGVLNDIPASHIKRIRVLKGPSAAAQFADSANGVILIETIRGSGQ
jgi:TonB-dependent starch-binding outer membrane protein SusC